MVDALKADWNQEAGRVAGAEDFALSAAISGELGGRIQQILRRLEQSKKGIWSKTNERE